MQATRQFCYGLSDSLAWWRSYYWIRHDPIVRQSILNNFRNSVILLVGHLVFSVGLKSVFYYLPITEWWIWFIKIYFLWAPPLYIVIHIFSFFHLRDMIMSMIAHANVTTATATKTMPLLDRIAQDIIRTIAVLLVSIFVQAASTSASSAPPLQILFLSVSSVIESYQIHEYWWCFGEWTAFERLKKVERELSYHLGFGLSVTLVQYFISGKVGVITAGAMLPFYVLAVLFKRKRIKTRSTSSSIMARTLIMITSTIVYVIVVACTLILRCCTRVMTICIACTKIDDEFF